MLTKCLNIMCLLLISRKLVIIQQSALENPHMWGVPERMTEEKNCTFHFLLHLWILWDKRSKLQKKVKSMLRSTSLTPIILSNAFCYKLSNSDAKMSQTPIHGFVVQIILVILICNVWGVVENLVCHFIAQTVVSWQKISLPKTHFYCSNKLFSSQKRLQLDSIKQTPLKMFKRRVEVDPREMKAASKLACTPNVLSTSEPMSAAKFSEGRQLHTPAMHIAVIEDHFFNTHQNQHLFKCHLSSMMEIKAPC